MNLYHYSGQKHDVLESLQAGERKAAGERLRLDPSGTLPPYNTSISFFLNRIPHNLPAILDNKHKFWQTKKLFENTVSVDALPKDFIFYIAETPERTKFLDEFDWSKASDPEVRKEYMFVIREWEIMKGFIGQGTKDFVKKASKYSGNLEIFYKRAYALAKKEKELDTFFTKYASGVPHAMIYHEDFKITDFKVEEITLGGNNLGTELFNSNPLSFNW